MVSFETMPFLIRFKLKLLMNGGFIVVGLAVEQSLRLWVKLDPVRGHEYFFKWANPGLFFVYFRSFQTNNTIFTTI